tara:strand:+ start:350 stop:535 length:186 start_codon:yes stop_codon:yes gene_type:complete
VGPAVVSDEYEDEGPETVVMVVVDAACLTALEDLLSAGVSYITAWGVVVCAAPTILTPLVG